MKIVKNFNLKKHNTFGIKAHCRAFVEVKTVKALKQVLAQNTLPIYTLGGGSNILFINELYDTFFIKNSIKGIKKGKITEGGILVEIGGGESWHSLVLWAIDNNLGGIENLSLIPGTVGAAPIQNIGAYGVELKDVFVKLEALNLQTLDIETFTHEDCQFGYRDSVFKKDLKGKYFITKVFLKLTTGDHKIKISYGDIQKILSEKEVEKPTIKDVSDAVISIRQSKLPDPSVIGNAGSFFKNPTVEKADFERLIQAFPNMPNYPVEIQNLVTEIQNVKLAAGWLIEQCGWKGKRLGDVGVHERQALVLVNYGNGHGADIKQLAEQIQASVFKKFGIALQAEVNVL
jgi:UDP-N-acetylmuramate dehydrogenase